MRGLWKWSERSTERKIQIPTKNTSSDASLYLHPSLLLCIHIDVPLLTGRATAKILLCQYNALLHGRTCLLFAGSWKQTKNYCILLLLMPNFNGCGFNRCVAFGILSWVSLYQPPPPLSIMMAWLVQIYSSSPSRSPLLPEVNLPLEDSYWKIIFGLTRIPFTNHRMPLLLPLQGNDKTLRSRCPHHGDQQCSCSRRNVDGLSVTLAHSSRE